MNEEGGTVHLQSIEDQFFCASAGIGPAADCTHIGYKRCHTQMKKLHHDSNLLHVHGKPYTHLNMALTVQAPWKPCLGSKTTCCCIRSHCLLCLRTLQYCLRTQVQSACIASDLAALAMPCRLDLACNLWIALCIRHFQPVGFGPPRDNIV